MLNLETQAHIRHLFYAEHWKIATITEQLGVHHDAVRHAIQTDSFHRDLALRRYITDAYLEFVREALKELSSTTSHMYFSDGPRSGLCLVVRRKPNS